MYCLFGASFCSYPFFVLRKILLDIQKFYSVVFTLITYLILNHIFILSFCTLIRVTTSHFLLYSISDVGKVHMLTDHRLCYVHSWMNEICMVPMQYVYLDFYKITILSLHVIILILILLPPQKQIYGMYHLYI